MVDVAAHVHNADVQWNRFSPEDYWQRNYLELQAEDQEIIRLVSQFFIAAFAGRPHARLGIDVGSGTNIYPALLMLPWTEQILGAINHDLKNMLTSAQIASERLAALKDPKVSQALPRLERALDRAVKLASGVLAY